MSDKVTQKTLAFKTFYRFFFGPAGKKLSLWRRFCPSCPSGPRDASRGGIRARFGRWPGRGGRSGEAPVSGILIRTENSDNDMNRRVKLAILALLGFSTACSTVKDSPRRDGKACGSDEAPAPDSVERKIPPRIVLMYGVRPPHPVQSVPRQDGGSAAPADSAAVRSGAPVSAVPAESAESVESAGGR